MSRQEIDRTPLLVYQIDGVTREDKAEAALTFQLFADSMERYDLLLLEIRHLQTNLVNAMRFADLNAALRFEESFIFGAAECFVGASGNTRDTTSRGWSEIFADPRLDLSPDKLPRLAEAFVPVLPTTDEETGADGGIENSDRRFDEFASIIDVHHAWRQVLGPASRELRRRRLTNRWDDTFDLNYAIFITLQALKRNIVLDKLHVAWFGVRAFVKPQLVPQLDSVPGMDPGAQRRAEFTIIRGASLYNLTNHVKRLANLQAQFESTLDVGSQENHRPITGRRREQGIYNFMLGERASSMFIEMSLLTAELLDSKHRKDLFGKMPVLLHHWSHEYSSRNETLISFSRSLQNERDRNGGTGEADRRATRPSVASFSINTSFWMPDRPDLQPVIAHEAAHCVLIELFGEFNDPSDRATYDGPLFDMWRALLTTDRAIRGSSISDKERLYEMREIVADLMGATITGPAYLFALYQKLTGWGFGTLPQNVEWREWADLGSMGDVLRQGPGQKWVSLNWYVRLYVMLHVMRDVLQKRKNDRESPLQELLFDGIAAGLDTMRQRLRALSGEDDEAAIDQWHHFAENLVDHLRKVGIVASLRDFYIKNYEPGKEPEDARDHERLILSRKDTALDKYDEPLTHRHFSPRIRRRLVEYLVERKSTNAARPAGKLMTDLSTDEMWKAKFFTQSATLPLKEREKRGKNDQSFRTRIQEWEAARPPITGGLHDLVRNNPEAAARAILRFVPAYLDAGQDVLLKLQASYDEICNHAHAKGDKKKRREALDKMLDQSGILEHLSDIPWQTTFLRAIELAAGCGSPSLSDDDCILRTLSADYAPGREIMQLGIEMWSYGQRRSVDTLGEANRLVRNFLALPVTNALPVAFEEQDGRAEMLLYEVTGSLVGRCATAQEQQEAAERIRAAGVAWKDDPRFASLADTWLEVADTLPKIGRAKACDILSRSFSEALEIWLGASFDGDFSDLEIQDLWRLGHRMGDTDTKRIEEVKDGYRPEAVRGAIRAWFKGGEVVEDFRGLARTIARYAKNGHVVFLDEVDQILQTQEDRTNQLADCLERHLEGNLTKVLCAGLHDTDGKIALDDSKRLTDMQSTGWLRDKTVQTVRLFEIGMLAQRMECLKQKGDQAIARRLDALADTSGAQQIVKLDRSYPDIVFPLWLTKNSSFGWLDLCRLFLDRMTGLPITGQMGMKIPYGKALDALEAVERQPAAPHVHDELFEALRKVAAHDAHALSRSLDVDQEKAVRARVQNMEYLVPKEFFDYWVDGKHLIRGDGYSPRLESVVRLTALTRVWTEDLLMQIARNSPVSFIDAAQAIHTSTLRQGETRPVTMRQTDERRARRRITHVTTRKLDALSVLFQFDALPVPEVEPIRTLCAKHRMRVTDPSREPEVFLGALSRGGSGLRTFGTISLSRQSLINSHWWGHESGENSPQGHFYQVGPDAKQPDEPPNEGSDPAVRAFATLGRYDYFSFANDAVLNHNRQPILDHALQGDDREKLYSSDPRPFSRLRRERNFRSFFERRENATAVALSGEPVNLIAPNITRTLRNGTTEDRDILCILSLRLDRRSSRLEFVNRIRQARKNWVAYRDHSAAMTSDNPYADANWRDALHERLRRAAEANPFDNSERKGKINELLERIFDHPRRRDLDDMHEKLAELSGNTLEDRQTRPGMGNPTKLCFEAARMVGDLPLLSLEAIGYFMQDGDCAFLGEGWGDLYLVFTCDPFPTQSGSESKDAYAQRLKLARQKGARRLYDIFAMQHILFQDHAVFRTEMFLRPAALPFASADAQDRFQLSVSVRLREDRELDGLVQRTIRSMRHSASWMLLRSVLGGSYPKRKDMEELLDEVAESDSQKYASWIRDLLDRVRISHIPGRNDLEFWIAHCRDIRDKHGNSFTDVSPSDALRMVHVLAGAGETNRGGGSEEVATRIGFRHFLLDPRAGKRRDGTAAYKKTAYK